VIVFLKAAGAAGHYTTAGTLQGKFVIMNDKVQPGDAAVDEFIAEIKAAISQPKTAR